MLAIQRNSFRPDLRAIPAFALAIALLLSFSATAAAQQIDPSAYAAMKWRNIGPFRAGRVTAVSGTSDDPNTYYIGTPGGGVWKTTDAGQVWTPIFDKERIASIGALAVAPSKPNIIYVGTGEQTQGNGVYRSNDAGATWANVGLRETHVITALAIDPRNPDVVLVGASGNQSSGAERGVFKTTDGGKSWQKVLFKDDKTWVMDLNFDLAAPDVVYATTWRPRMGGPGPANPHQPPEQDAAIYKSTDAGANWTPVGGKGLPSEPMGRIGVVVAPGSRGNTAYAIMTQGFFRSDDGGDSWRQTNHDPRIVGNSYFSRVFVDPKDPEVVYVAQTSMYRSSDGGKTFDAWVGAPSGDDFHVLWINPRTPQNMVLGVDQGAIVSVNGGKTWSSWYNQPTGQFYHVSTDNRFPYYVYAAQQDSGTAAVASRSDYGEIGERDWAPTGGFEFSFIAPDPLDPTKVYIGGWYGSVLRYDRTTGQIVHLFVRTSKYRTAGMAPIAFSPQDPHTLYVGAQFVMKTTDAGSTWQEISPDLTLKPATAPNAPPSAPPGAPPNNGVIASMAISRVTAGLIWVGTSNGLIHVTRDGSTWQAVTPAGLPERSTVNAIEASAHDAAEAYAVINAFQTPRPLVFRTRDYGQSWQPITTGLADNVIARIVREDPVRKGLLYAGTETGAYLSFDDGDHWQSLQLDLPVTPVRDLDVHGDDLVAATYGRALWILDDVTPLRQLDARLVRSDVALLHPQDAVRVRWDMNQDTPLPIETPAARNPPDGAIIDYFLKAAPRGEIKLALYDSQNNLVREYTSTPPPVDNTPANVPSYWFAPPTGLSRAAGLNRFVWNLRYPSPKTLRYSYYGNHLDYIEYTLADHAIPGETPREQPEGPLAIPGDYLVVLTVAGKSYRQPLKITLDPRVKVSQQDLVQQLDAERNILAQMSASYDGYEQLAALRAAIAGRQKALAGNPSASDATEAMKTLDAQVAKIQDGTRTDPGVGPLNRELARLAGMIESGDARPAAALQAGVDQSCVDLAKRLAEWRELNKALATANALLQKYRLQPLPAGAAVPADPPCHH